MILYNIPESLLVGCTTCMLFCISDLKMSRRQQIQMLLNVAKRGNAKITSPQRNKASVVGAIPVEALDIGVSSSQEGNIPFEQMPGPRGFPLLGTIPYHFPGGKKKLSRQNNT